MLLACTTSLKINRNAHSVILWSEWQSHAGYFYEIARINKCVLAQRERVSMPLERPKKSCPLFLTDSRTPVDFENFRAACTSPTD